MTNERFKYIESLAPVLLQEMLKGSGAMHPKDLQVYVTNSVEAAGLLFDELQKKNAVVKDK